MELKKNRMMLVCFIIVVLAMTLGSISASAATIGEELAEAEEGWIRIEDTNPNIQYEGVWISNPYEGYSGGNAHYSQDPTQDAAQVMFKFRGTKFRIISQTNIGGDDNITVNIDGKINESFSEYNGSITGGNGCKRLVYEKTGLEDGIHTVVLSKTGVYFLQLDAIDLEATGEILDINTPDGIAQKLCVLLNINEQVQLSTSYNLAGNLNYIWTSANEAVATVDINGKVTAVGPGEAEIYAESTDGAFKECISVRVLENADEVRLAVHLRAGEKAKLYLTDDPSQVTWSSMDETVATVSANGQVTGVAKGLAIVQGTFEGKNYQIYVRINA